MVDFALIDESTTALPAKSELPHERDALMDHMLGQREELSDTERVICFLVAEGRSFEDACSTLGLKASTAKQMKAQRKFLDLVLKIQTALRLPVGEQMRRLAPLAVQRKLELMQSKNEAVANSASSFIIEQAEGKAVQKIEVQSFNLNAQMEVKEVDNAIEATQRRLADLERRSRITSAGKAS